jgi:DNA-binding Lrp family transcriptional regulator
MNALADDWRNQLDPVDASLIDEYQSEFPICERPFAQLGDMLDITEHEVLERVKRLYSQGIFRRFGAVLNPPVIGSSTLAAVKAPESRFDAIAEHINTYPQVNHNYRREHAWNMWFVVTAGSQDRRDSILTEIESGTDCTVMSLPMLTDYYIDLEFPVVNQDTFARESLSQTTVDATRISEEATGDLRSLEVSILLEIQDGYPLTQTPYRDIAKAVGTDTESVIRAISRLCSSGCIKRIGCIVNHVMTGFSSNCMIVWDVPDGELDERGEAVGKLPYVTLCYHRPRRPAFNWSYNLFTMIHGRQATAVDRKIDELAAEYLPYEHERLYSTETLKQTGARYEDLIEETTLG